MIKEYKTKTMFFFALSCALVLLAAVVCWLDGYEEHIWLVILLMPFHFVLFTAASIFYAQGKRQNPVWGVMGILHILGLIVLIYLKDKSKEE